MINAGTVDIKGLTEPLITIDVDDDRIFLTIKECQGLVNSLSALLKDLDYRDEKNGNDCI